MDFWIWPISFTQLITVKKIGTLESEFNDQHDQQRMSMVMLFTRSLSTSMGRSSPPPWPDYSSLPDVEHTQFWKQQRSYLELFIMKRPWFTCLLVSEGGGSGEIKRVISRHLW